MADRIWTVVRFPNGSWSYGGKPDSPDYEHCEVWQIEAATAKEAVKKAQAKRSRQRRNDGAEGTRHQVQGPRGTDGQQDHPLSLSRGGGGEVDRHL